MEKKNNKEEIKDEIQELGLKALKEYFGVSKTELMNIDPKLISYITQRAKLAMQFEREMNLNNRFVERNYLRVFKLISEDRDELKRLIKKSLPIYYSD
jgi:hypothetical protein